MTRTIRIFTTPVALLLLVAAYSAAPSGDGPTEAPTGFDNLTNGFTTQDVFNADRAVFEERDTIDGGLGPVYNAQSCAECHQSPVTGAISQTFELRAATYKNGVYTDHPGGSLINDRAIDAAIVEQVYDGENVQTLRSSLNTLGDGFVESIADSTLLSIGANQPAGMQGLAITVPVVERRNATAIGRFGWKDQHASLLSFSGDAYLNEQGITNRLFRTENTSNGNSVAAYDTVPDPEDTDNDVDIFARFMRATKAPPVDPVLSGTADAMSGSVLFNQVGCNICHVRRIVTAPPGTAVAGGAFIVPAALGNKIIHPFSDFLLHDVGTGDGIIQNGGTASMNKMRTPPLWGSRTRTRFMHDGKQFRAKAAIQRHANEAQPVVDNFNALTNGQKDQLIAFLESL